MPQINNLTPLLPHHLNAVSECYQYNVHETGVMAEENIENEKGGRAAYPFLFSFKCVGKET